MFKRHKYTILLAALMLLSAWSLRPAFNRVKSVSITVGTQGSTPGQIPTYFSYYQPNSNSGGSSVIAAPGSSLQSIALTGLADDGYSHLQVVNNTSTRISVVTSSAKAPLSVPASNSSEKLFVAASGYGTWDDVSIFDYLYVKSEGSSISSGNIDIMVW